MYRNCFWNLAFIRLMITKMNNASTIVLLFYAFTPIGDPKKLASDQKELCERLGLKGRLLIAKEGINGTLAGTRQAAKAYQSIMADEPRFASMPFKVSESAGNPFPKLMVKTRREIVTLGVETPHNIEEAGGKHLSPAEWKRMIKEDEDVILFDTRNRYESDIGRFKGAILPNTENFRDLPDLIEQYESYKDKKFLMYCTGGIRCEKATVLFRKAGFKKVFQLHGGIVNYWKEEGADLWEGDCFVFDERMTLEPPETNGKIRAIGKCAHTGVSTRNFVNCLHDPCHRLFLVHPKVMEDDTNKQLCPDCLGKGLNLDSAVYPGSPSMPPGRRPKNRGHRGGQQPKSPKKK
jgi:UPF0176 protein